MAQDEGEKTSHGFTDGAENWYHVRVASSDQANKAFGYTFDKHVEAIGLNGWNYSTRSSHWVGFDFDSISTHTKGLSEKEIESIKERVKAIPWVETRLSTSGKGLHLYVHFKHPVATADRKEHSKLAKNVLAQISLLIGADFKQKVDTSGGILWIWHRKGNKPNSFALLSAASERLDFKPIELPEEAKQVATAVKLIDLEPAHKKVIEWLAKQNCQWWWDSELRTLVTHTVVLKKCKETLGLKGIFDTVSTGKDLPGDHNCFLFPIKNGAWIVRRFGLGTKEHTSWKQDKSGWTCCYFNRTPTLSECAHLFGGGESSRGDFAFSNLASVKALLKQISPVDIEFPQQFFGRQIRLKPLKDAKLALIFDAVKDEDCPEGWIRGKGRFEKVIVTFEEEKEIRTPDNLIRHIVAENKDADWCINIRNTWIDEPKNHVSLALTTLGYNSSEGNEILGQCILNPWFLTNRPFESEYPGNREWNRFAAQLAYEPIEGEHPTWDLLLTNHAKNLDVTESSWCQAFGVSAKDYLLYWVAAMFQCPTEPLPYLFFFGEQNSGKSSLHEALKLLTTKGVVRADRALTNPSGFNGELAGAILAVVEEVNLSTAKGAYERLKDWVTGKTMSIRFLYMTPFDLPNTSHWIQCANTRSACPVSVGDSRVVMVRVDPPDRPIPKEEFLAALTREAPHFLNTLLTVEIPKAIDRMRIPVITTPDKTDEEAANANPVELFIREKCFLIPGQMVNYRQFYDAFVQWNEGEHLSIRKVGSMLPVTVLKGRRAEDAQWYLGNIAFENLNPTKPLTKKGDFLV